MGTIFFTNFDSSLISLLPPSKNRMWIRAISIGEVQAISPLIKTINSKNFIEIVLTITIPKIYKIFIEKHSNQTQAIGLFHLDFLHFFQNTWNRIQPDLALLVKSELWPEHLLHQTKALHTPFALINSRISNKSYNRYLKIKSIPKDLLKCFSLILASTPQDHQHYINPDAYPESTRLIDNLKFNLTKKKIRSLPEKQTLRQSLSFDSQIIILGSSTWSGKGKLLLETLKKNLKLHINCQLFIIPRHIERRHEIISLLQNYCFTCHLRSSNKPAPNDYIVSIADTTGELTILSQITDLAAFIGKALDEALKQWHSQNQDASQNNRQPLTRALGI